MEEDIVQDMEMYFFLGATLYFQNYLLPFQKQIHLKVVPHILALSYSSLYL